MVFIPDKSLLYFIVCKLKKLSCRQKVTISTTVQVFKCLNNCKLFFKTSFIYLIDNVVYLETLEIMFILDYNTFIKHVKKYEKFMISMNDSSLKISGLNHLSEI